MAEEKQLGLIQLWPPTDSTVETRLDIVAIHGLGGHPLKTWTDGGNLWLRDFLPTFIPEARVLTYGYDSGIAFDKSASEIPDFARDLLERVRAIRRKGPKNRPIIVVCHSLGGIVFKKALVIAHERERYADLLQCVKSVMFMGTPHRGADIAYWSKILGKMANIPLLGSLRTNLLTDLEPKSKVLGEVCSQFVERGKNLQIFSFYERVKTSGLNDLVVDQDSAILHLPNETPLPVEADHRGMCKFLTASDQRFQIVLSSLQELVEETEGCEESST